MRCCDWSSDVCSSDLHLPSSPFISLHLSSSPFISLPLPSSPFISLHLPSSLFISLHLPSSPFFSLLLSSSLFFSLHHPSSLVFSLLLSSSPFCVFLAPLLRLTLEKTQSFGIRGKASFASRVSRWKRKRLPVPRFIPHSPAPCNSLIRCNKTPKVFSSQQEWVCVLLSLSFLSILISFGSQSSDRSLVSLSLQRNNSTHFFQVPFSCKTWIIVQIRTILSRPTLDQRSSSDLEPFSASLKLHSQV